MHTLSRRKVAVFISADREYDSSFGLAQLHAAEGGACKDVKKL